MTPAELFKRDDYKNHKQAAFNYLKKFYSTEDDVNFWYNQYLLALLENKLYPSFTNPESEQNGIILGTYTETLIDSIAVKEQKLKAGKYFFSKLTTGFQNGMINKMIFNPRRYAVEVTSTETGKTFTDLLKEATSKTGEQIGTAATQTVAAGFDLVSILKTALPLILIVILYILYKTYMPKK